MPDNSEQPISTKERLNNSLSEIFSIVEWLLVALILALLFRAFIMEAYRIPTGSMAHSLNGDFFRVRCQQCGYRFDHGFDTSEHGLARYTVPADGKATPRRCRCPSCGYDLIFENPIDIDSGDRILVLKCLYQWRHPKRWDVSVFKDPQEPQSNIVKRLIGMPGELIEIIDGDVYIDGLIARKPTKVQNVLWVPVYDNNYQPVRPDEGSFSNSYWENPIIFDDTDWRVDDKDPTKFVLNSDDSRMHWFIYNCLEGNRFRAAYAYNDSSDYEQMPYCSDIMIRFNFKTDYGGKIGAELSKYGIKFRASADSGRMIISRIDSDGEELQLASKQINLSKSLSQIPFQFSNVDRLLVFELGRNRLSFDLGRTYDSIGPINPDIKPQVKIFASGVIELSNLAIFRDIHYTEHEFAGMNSLARGASGNAFQLEADEFFMLGDNSPSSYDSRWWERDGRGNDGKRYRAGCVPREYLFGKAVMVYWPSGYKPFKDWPAAVPNIGRIRFIYGGSNKKSE
ncbi:MAG: signal peptidase I [Phycisphaerae bacterium]